MRHLTTAASGTIAVSNTSNSNVLPTMESLRLPAELYWDGKSEPSSPSSELFSIAEYTFSEHWIDEDNIANEIIDSDEELKAELGLDDSSVLLNGEDMVMELCELSEEHWNNTKLHTPNDLVGDYTIENGGVVFANPITKVFLPNNFDLVQIGNTVGGIETLTSTNQTPFANAVLTQLTPPHSPPLQNINIINQNVDVLPANNLNPVIQEAQQALLLPEQQQQPQLHEFVWSQSSINNITTTPIKEAKISTTIPPLREDIQRDLELVDEIVNTRANELMSWNEEFDTLSYSSVSSLAASLHADDSITDEDWISSSTLSYTSSVSGSPKHSNSEEFQQQHNNIETAETSSAKLTNKKRTRPYGRGAEDRKLRKKEQNKNAATRYRQKKKLEMEIVLSEEQQLTQRNEELQRILAERQREVKYLKTLIREFYQKQKQQKKKQNK